MKLHRLVLLVVLFLATACTPISFPSPGSTGRSSAKPTGGANALFPDVKITARTYLDAWKADDYHTMYSLLTSISQDALTEDEFTKHYQGIAAEAALQGVDYEIQSSLIDPNTSTAQVSFKVSLHSTIVGDIQRDTSMNLHLEQGQWRVEWDDTLVLPELAGGNYLGMDLDIPARANIYDWNGHALVAQTDATAIGLLPDQLDPSQADALFAWLTQVTGMRAEDIQARYANYPPGSGWYLPLGEVPAEEIAKNYEQLSTFKGLVMRPYKSRFYFDGGVAPHVVGYVSALQPDEVDAYRRKGYKQDERVGRAGLEKWGEPYLAGQRGGTLFVYNSQGQYFAKLGETTSKPSQAIYTTLDRDFQEAAEQAISGFNGAIVVLERDTGRVLAMVSSPGFDPNAFEPSNYNYSSMLEEIFNNPNQPLLNRATQGQYPLGSVFKIVTMAAALESGVYTPESTYQCGYFFNELPGITLHDWTYEYKTAPSGLLTLPGGLIRSCNPWFWHIGLDLYNRDMTHTISDMARGFGLGEKTGIEGVDEAAGNVPDPQSPSDAVNLAIGQGDFLATPLQVADFIAAVGNGGTLYRPQLVEKIVPPGGDPSYVFKPETRGKLPVSPENLKVIQDALVGVINSTEPRGTAYYAFTGFDVPVAGKTGTAQSGNGLPHAWFAGYTYAGREDKPDIAVAIVVENIGEGSDYAAPIFRRIVSLYFQDTPGRLYPWESSVNVTSTPSLEDLSTPTPQP